MVTPSETVTCRPALLPCTRSALGRSSLRFDVGKAGPGTKLSPSTTCLRPERMHLLVATDSASPESLFPQSNPSMLRHWATKSFNSLATSGTGPGARQRHRSLVGEFRALESVNWQNTRTTRVESVALTTGNGAFSREQSGKTTANVDSCATSASKSI